MDQLQELFAENAPVVPLFPGPKWGAYNTTRFTGFPDEDNPYAPLSTRSATTRSGSDDDRARRQRVGPASIQGFRQSPGRSSSARRPTSARDAAERNSTKER